MTALGPVAAVAAVARTSPVCRLAAPGLRLLEPHRAHMTAVRSYQKCRHKSGLLPRPTESTLHAKQHCGLTRPGGETDQQQPNLRRPINSLRKRTYASGTDDRRAWRKLEHQVFHVSVESSHDEQRRSRLLSATPVNERRTFQ